LIKDSYFPIQNAIASYDALVFAKKTAASIDQGLVGLEFYNQPLNLIVGNTIIPLNEVIDIYQLKRRASNLEKISEQACIIAVDCAMDDVFGNKPINNLDEEVGAIRAIIYMLRCAFAHSIYDPVWVVKKTYRRIFTISKMNLNIDFARLDGERVNCGQLGSWVNLYGLILLSIIEMNTHVKNQDMG
jgi:hypothetical protein